MLKCRGIKGATTAAENSAAAILEATRELLEQMIAANQFVQDDVAAMLFTCTPDLNAAFPARAARDLGFDEVALTCAQEIDVPGALPRCIRVIAFVNTEERAATLKHVYLREAKALRPDIA